MWKFNFCPYKISNPLEKSIKCEVIILKKWYSSLIRKDVNHDLKHFQLISKYHFMFPQKITPCTLCWNPSTGYASEQNRTTWKMSSTNNSNGVRCDKFQEKHSYTQTGHIKIYTHTSNRWTESKTVTCPHQHTHTHTYAQCK